MPFIDRIIANLADVNLTSLRRGMLDEHETKRVDRALESLAKAKNQLHVISNDDMTCGTVSTIAAKVRKCNPDILFIDGAYLLQDTEGFSSVEQAKNVIRSLKALAKKESIPVIVTWQLNGKASNENGGSLENISFSDAVGMDSDLVVTLSQTEDMRLNQQMHIKSIKQRDCKPFEFDINWDFDNMDFSELVEDTADDLDF